jgi:hypothetical protein
MKIRTFSELQKIESFDERFEYLKLNGEVGKSTFGFDRYLNQNLYNSKLWLRARDSVIIRDNGCDLSSIDHPIIGRVIVHHMNPVTIEDLKKRDTGILDPEYLVCVSHKTHLALHYGDANLLQKDPIIRKPGDTSPWLMEKNMAKRKDFPVKEDISVIEKRTVPSVYIVSNCDYLNVRKSPNKKADVLFLAGKGASFYGEESIDGWFKVKEVEGQYRSGYVLSDFLKEKPND